MNSIVLNIHNLSLSYQKNKVFDSFSLTLCSGQCLGIQGASGCGKSSLLHAIVKLIPELIPCQIDGSIYILGKDSNQIPTTKMIDYVGMVVQNTSHQFYFTTVFDEIAFGLENKGVDVRDIYVKIETITKLMRIDHLLQSNPLLLSGGQQQLVLLACILVLNPPILLLDEPFSHLDNNYKEIMIHVLNEYKNRGNSIILVDHNTENFLHCDKVIDL